jgi:adenosine kinase
VVATAGSDFGPYAEWLDRHGIRRDGIRVLEDLRTAQGFVTTDLDDNQIWAFYVGAMGRAHEAPLPPPGQELRLAIVSSDSRQAMLERARELKRRGVPTFVDPSHALPILDHDDLVELIDGAAGYVVNDYEWSLTLDKTGLGEDEIARRCGAVVVTRGEQGSTIREGERTIEIPPVPARRVVDPTACGDAYRAGLLAGRARGLSFATAGRMGSLLGSYQVEIEGPQALRLDPGEFRARFEREFGQALG